MRNLYFRSIVVGACTLFIASHASATSKKDLTYVTIGFGSDGATLQPVPKKDSATMAKKVYNGISGTLDKMKRKFVGIEFDGDQIGLICEKPKRGITTVTAGCEMTTLQRGGRDSIEEGDYEFMGRLAEMIFNGIAEKYATYRIGATTKKVGNLSCSHIPQARGGVYKCKFFAAIITMTPIKSTNPTPEEMKKFNQLASELGI